MMPGPVPVLTAVTGRWEAPLVAGLERGNCGVQVVRRCADLGELLAAAQAGLARAVVVSADLPRLDGEALAGLRARGVPVVVLAEPGAPGTAQRLRLLGVPAPLPADATADAVAEAVLAAVAGQDSGPIIAGGAAGHPGDVAGVPAPGPGTGRSVPGAPPGASAPGSVPGPAGSRAASVGWPPPDGPPPDGPPADGPPAAASPPGLPSRLPPGESSFSSSSASSAAVDPVPGAGAGVGSGGPAHGSASNGSASHGSAPGPAEGSGAGGARPGRLLAVWGPTGAPGRTTVAVTLACELARAGYPTLIADADTYGPSVAQTLALLDESAGLAAAVRAANQGSLDLQRLAVLAPAVQPGLRVLTGIPRPGRWPELRPSGLRTVWQLARSLAAWTVVDCGFGLESDEELSFDVTVPRRNGATLCTLAEADLVLVVGAADPLGLHRLVRGLQDLREVLPTGTSRRVVVTKVRDASVGSPARHNVTDALARYAGVRDAVLVPDDRAACDAAMLVGRSLAEVAPQSPARQALAGLAAELAPDCGTAGRGRQVTAGRWASGWIGGWRRHGPAPGTGRVGGTGRGGGTGRVAGTGRTPTPDPSS